MNDCRVLAERWLSEKLPTDDADYAKMSPTQKVAVLGCIRNKGTFTEQQVGRQPRVIERETCSDAPDHLAVQAGPGEELRDPVQLAHAGTGDPLAADRRSGHGIRDEGRPTEVLQAYLQVGLLLSSARVISREVSAARPFLRETDGAISRRATCKLLFGRATV